MKEEAGKVFSIAKDNKAVEGCTISKEVHSGENYISYFSMAEDTDISAELFPYHKLIVLAEGELEVYGFSEDTKKDSIMNKAVKAGEVFQLSNLVQYQDGKIVNMDVVHNDKMKFVVMAFDEGTGLSEHAAPGEAMIFALDGEAIIGYEGTEHVLKAGENFHFAKAGKHCVKADKKFKMALLLTLE